MFSVSFPGLGIDQFDLNMVAFSIGKISVRWYGIIITLGIIAAFAYASFRAKQNGISADDMYDMTIYAVISGVIGARAYYVINTLGEGRYDSFLDVIAIWKGGLAIYGGLIGGALAVFIYCKVKKLNFLLVADTVIPGVELAQAIGRWGNFFNGEAYGATPSEDSLLYFLRMGLQHEGWAKEYFYQPCFLYESVWNLLGFTLINILYKKKKFNGQIFCMYVAWYGFGRMIIEGTRTDSLYLGVFRISQVIGFCCFVLGTVALIIGLANARKKRLAQGEYQSVYGRVLKERERAEKKKAAEAAGDNEASESEDNEPENGNIVAETTEEETENNSENAASASEGAPAETADSESENGDGENGETVKAGDAQQENREE